MFQISRKFLCNCRFADTTWSRYNVNGFLYACTQSGRLSFFIIYSKYGAAPSEKSTSFFNGANLHIPFVTTRCAFPLAGTRHASLVRMLRNCPATPLSASMECSIRTSRAMPFRPKFLKNSYFCLKYIKRQNRITSVLAKNLYFLTYTSAAINLFSS
jgi:hypothetical protein